MKYRNKKMLLLTIIFVVLLSAVSCTTSHADKMKNQKVLVAYFSATGTTKAQAEAMAEAVGGTIYEITPQKIYTTADLNWRNKQSRSSVEMADEKCRPALGGKKVKADSYDVVFVGYPIWWDLCPRVVNTWIESQNLKGKVVIPFATSGGSTISNSEKVLRKLYPQCKWKEGKLLNCSASEAQKWAKEAIK